MERMRGGQEDRRTWTGGVERRCGFLKTRLQAIGHYGGDCETLVMVTLKNVSPFD